MTWSKAWSWQDVQKQRASAQAWQPSRAAERRYAKQLRSVGREVSRILEAHPDPATAARQLQRYADKLKPWAAEAAENMVRTCKRHSDQGWRAAAGRWGINLKGLLSSDISAAVRSKIADNIKLITSLPLQAAESVGTLAREAVESGMRADTLAKRIAAEGNLAMSRAQTIARTEISKTGTAMTRARAEAVGSEGYIWRTTRDGNRRASHAAMEGKFVRWDSPPTLDGMTGHAGESPNCRCYPEPVIHEGAARKAVPSPLPTQEQEKASGEIKRRSQWERVESHPMIPHTEGRALHNVERADFALDKLTRYSMDLDHPSGRDKARVWQAALGMNKDHAQEVRQQIMSRIADYPALRDLTDEHGERFTVLVPVTGPNGRTVDVTTAWIYKAGNGSVSSKPRLVTCFVGR
ncbi:DUF6883 domain-containing protein [Pseudodesulfovibrio sp.]|uniref:phage head morphogenesis protein n=1 Tax=Pseudodesulfovibrio sp. TaxID=2035812 RepID=UPI00260CB90C|nr:DUF6883 domain-containing protein [Pseudodesulfovibrio sp.]MDD3310963.1 phage minor head protein [Pseudodesulfovibrio sp.]